MPRCGRGANRPQKIEKEADSKHFSKFKRFYVFRFERKKIQGKGVNIIMFVLI